MLPFLIRTSQRVSLPVPQDDALDADQRRDLLEFDLTPRPWPEGAVLFELRGLSATETDQLRPLLPRAPEGVQEYYAAVLAPSPTPEQAERLRDVSLARTANAYQTALQAVYLRAGLVTVQGIDGWPTTREEFLGLRLWPTTTLDGLPSASRAWLAAVVWRLTHLDAEKKRLSSSVPDAPTGTTADLEGRTAAAPPG